MNACTTGGYNTAVGRNALNTLTTGSNDVAVGANAGTVLATGAANCTHVGFQAGNSAAASTTRR